MAFAFLKRHTHSFWDQIGMTVSSLCFLHCILTPVVVLSLPWLAPYAAHPIFHLVIFLFVVPIGAYAFWQGYKHHHNKWVLAIGIPGLLLVGLGAFFPHEAVEHGGDEIITIFGSLLLIIAHFLNWRTCRQHRHHVHTH